PHARAASHRRRRFLLGRRQDGLYCRISTQARILLRKWLPPLPLWIRSGRIEAKTGGGQVSLTRRVTAGGLAPAFGLAVEIEYNDRGGLGGSRLILPALHRFQSRISQQWTSTHQLRALHRPVRGDGDFHLYGACNVG